MAKRAVVANWHGKLERTISIDRLPEEGKRILHTSKVPRHESTTLELAGAQRKGDGARASRVAKPLLQRTARVQEKARAGSELDIGRPCEHMGTPARQHASEGV